MNRRWLITGTWVVEDNVGITSAEDALRAIRCEAGVEECGEEGFHGTHGYSGYSGNLKCLGFDAREIR